MPQFRIALNCSFESGQLNDGRKKMCPLFASLKCTVFGGECKKKKKKKFTLVNKHLKEVIMPTNTWTNACATQTTSQERVPFATHGTGGQFDNSTYLVTLDKTTREVADTFTVTCTKRKQHTRGTTKMLCAELLQPKTTALQQYTTIPCTACTNRGLIANSLNTTLDTAMTLQILIHSRQDFCMAVTY